MPPTEAEFRAFIGPNADYYLRGWTRVQPNTQPQRLGWNWPAFFLNIIWLLYRRMYRYFWIGLGVLALIGILQGMLEQLLPAATPLHNDFIINFLVACWFGSHGTWYYYRHAEKTIGQIRTGTADAKAIAQAGGVRPLLAAIVGFVIGVLALGALAVRSGA